MIDFKVNRGMLERGEVRGDPNTVIVEVAQMLRYIYSAAEKSNHEAAELFKRGVQVMTLEDSPVWQASEEISGIFAAIPIKGEGAAE